MGVWYGYCQVFSIQGLLIMYGDRGADGSRESTPYMTAASELRADFSYKMLLATYPRGGGL